jgi:hypothetical protein
MYSLASVRQDAPSYYNHDLESHKTEARTQMTRPHQKPWHALYKGTLLKGFFYAHLTRARMHLRAPAHLTGVIACDARTMPTTERP